MFDVRLHAYLRALMETHALRVGPFLVSLDPRDAGPFRNYAVPDDGAAPSPAEVAALTAHFRERRRAPRLEYLPSVSPRVEPALLAAGFVAERRLPVMTPRPDASLRSAAPDGVDVGLAVDAVALREVAAAQNEAYGQAATTEHDVARLRTTVARGGIVALARDRYSGHGIGGGLCAPPYEGVSELAAVGVRPGHRRRGVATALTALLTRSAPEHGIDTPFLTPAGADEERLYRAVGYRPVAEMLHVGAPRW